MVKQFDAKALALLMIAIIPWLSPIIKSLKFGDIEIELLQKIEETQKQAEKARDVADEAKGASQSAILRTQEALAKATEPGRRSVPEVQELDLVSKLTSLQDAYARVRKSMRGGETRTKRMTEMLYDMRDVTKRLNQHQFDHVKALKSDHPGEHLAGVAFAYEHADTASLSDLVEAAIRPTKPFNQYWALRALRAALEARGTTPFTSDEIRALRELHGRFDRDWDRAYELNEFLKEYDKLAAEEAAP